VCLLASGGGASTPTGSGPCEGGGSSVRRVDRGLRGDPRRRDGGIGRQEDGHVAADATVLIRISDFQIGSDV